MFDVLDIGESNAHYASEMSQRRHKSGRIPEVLQPSQPETGRGLWLPEGGEEDTELLITGSRVAI